MQMAFSNSNFNTPEGKIAKEVALQYIANKAGRTVKPNAIRKEAELMLRLTNEIEVKHEVALKNMCNRLNVNSENAGTIFREIANEIFLDGINWGRIIVLHAFSGKLAEHAKQNNNIEIIDKIGPWLATSVANKSSWIKDGGKGWNGFIETFHDARPEREASWFQGVLAATVGFGTIAAAIYIKS